MLLKIRDITTGWFAAVIIALLIIPFAFFGINYYFGQGTEPLAAKINDTDITLNQYQRALRNFREQLKQTFGSQSEIPDDLLKTRTMDRLVNSELIYQKTDEVGLGTSDEAVLQTIASIKQFHNENDGFDKSLYQLYINTLGMSPAAFEQQVRLDMVSEQLQSAISESAFVIEQEVSDLASLKDQRRDFDYLNLLVSKYKKDIDVTDDQINEYYQSNLDAFYHEDKVKAEYIDLSVEKISDRVEISPDELESYYQANKVNYAEPEKRKTWQFVVRKNKDADTDRKAAELAKVDELIEVLKNAESFEEIAEQYVNNNPEEVQVDAAESGLVPKGGLVAEVDEVLFALEMDETSEAIETKDAYYVIRLKEMEASVDKPFTDVKEQVEKDLRNEKARRDYFDLAELLATTAYEHPESLTAATDALDIEIEESDYFTLEQGDGLFKNTRLRQTAFSEDVLDTGYNSDAIEISDERIVVLRIKDRIPAGPKPLEDVYEDVADLIRVDVARQRVLDISNKIKSAMEQGKNLEQAAAEFELEIESAREVAPNDINVSRSVIRTAFQMSEPKDGNTVFDATLSGNGDYAFIELIAVRYPEDIKGIQIDGAKNELIKARAGSEWEAYFNDIKASASIEIFENNL